MKPRSLLPKDACDRLGRLLDLNYTVDELCREIRTGHIVITRCIQSGCPVEIDGSINGRLFRAWASDPRLAKQRLVPVLRENWKEVQSYLASLQKYKQLDELSIEAYRICLKRTLQWACEIPFPLAPKIEPTLPAFLLSGGIEKYLSPTTTARTCQVTRAFFEHMRREDPGRYDLVDERWINTLQMGRKHGKQTVLKQHVFYHLGDVRKIAWLNPATLRERRDIAATCFLYLSGMRISAFTSIPARLVDVERLTVKQLPTEGVRTKNSKAAVTSLLPIDDLLDVVRDWDNFLRENAGDDALWYAPLYEAKQGGFSKTPSNGGLNRDHIFRKGLKVLCSRAGIGYLSPHKLRHGHTVYCMKRARTLKDLKAISQNLLHSSIAITDSIYGNLTFDDVNEAISGLVEDRAQRPSEDTDALLAALIKLQNDPGLLRKILES